MNKLTELEKQNLKVKLTRIMEKYITEITIVDNDLGYLPENIETYMANAAFAVLESVNATNIIIEENK